MRSKSAYWQAGSLALACVLTFARPSPAQQASCEAAFTGDPISGCASLLVTFSTQTKDAMAYSWQFPGGYPSTATGQGPHTVDYSAPGVYSVQLIVTCRDQSADTLMRRNYITVSDCPTAIGETVWQDDNGNGIQDAGESGLPNVPTALYKSNGTLVATTLTDVNGGYLFSGLDYGNYYVQFTLLSGYVFSAKDQGSDDSKDSDADPSTGNTDVFFLASDVTDRTRDAGMIPDIQRMEIDTWMDVCYTLDLSIPGVGKSTVSLIGTAVQHVSVGPAGQASDTDGDGRDQVQTELATLNLSGMDPLFGSVVLRLNPSRASYGEIEEHANVTPGILDLPPFTATGMADSYFEALFEIQLTDMGLCLRNEPPVHFHAVIGHKPSLNFNVHTAIMLYPEPLYRVTCGIGAWTLPSPPPDPKAYLAGMAACDPQTQTGETDTWLDVCYAVQLNVPGLGVSTVNLSGTAVQHVSVGPAGEASDTDSDGRDQAQTALTTLNLTGMDPLFGSVSLRLDPSRVSFGEIEEHANVTPGILDLPPFRASGAATSFFDVFLEIQLNDLGICLRHGPPVRIQAVINHKPATTFSVHAALLSSPEPLYSLTCGTGAWSLPVPPPNPAAFLNGMTACGSQSQTEIDVLRACLGIELELLGLGHSTVQVTGSMTQAVHFEGAAAGDATDGNSNGLDDVSVDLVDVNLQGIDPLLGHVVIRLNPAATSVGMIEETVNSSPGTLDVPPFTPTGTAFSVFDAYFEIQLMDMGICLRTALPIRLQGTIDHKPPGATDVYSAVLVTPVPLYKTVCGSGTTPLPNPPPSPSGAVIQVVTCGSVPQSERFDYGDAPAPYPTLVADNGARHPAGALVQGPILGSLIDSENDGQPDPNAAGDDVLGIDDEDGILFSTPLVAGSTASIQVTASYRGILNAWIDFNADGDWADAGEQIVVNVSVPAGTSTLSIAVPASAVAGPTHARFRISGVEGLSYTGAARDGEVEDYRVRIGENKPDFDLGDAPDGTNTVGPAMTAYPAGGPPDVAAHFPTVFMAGSPPFGPRHKFPREIAWLGPLVTLEQEADVGADEDGTNNLLPSADLPDRDGADDGVPVPLVLPSCQPSVLSFTMTAAHDFKYLYANVWFDWTRDGDWNDNPTCGTGLVVSEWAVQNQVIGPGSAGIYTITTSPFVPWHPDTKEPQPIWMRITLSERRWIHGEMLEAGAGPRDGYEFGETEDYYFVPTVEGDRDFGDAPEPYPTALGANGARHGIKPGLCLGPLIDPESDGQPDTDATGDDLNGVDDEDGVTFTSDLVPGGDADIYVFASGRGYLTTWVDFNRDGDWADAGEHVINDVLLSAGNNPLTFPVPASAVPGKTYARFRFSRETGLNADGPAEYGEVEDYLVRIPQSGKNPIKWNQPPLKVRRAEWPDSLWHCHEGFSLPSIEGYLELADDWICRDPKPVTSVTWWGSYAAWDTTVAPPNAPWGFRITLYKDVPKDRDTLYSRPGEKVAEWKVERGAAGESVAGSRASLSRPDSVFRYSFYIPPADWFYQEGDSTLYWVSISVVYPELPSEHVWGWLTRSRYFHDEAAFKRSGGAWQPIHGLFMIQAEGYYAQSDMTFVLGTTDTRREFDFGDAPDPLFPTLLASGGAEHWMASRVRLGSDIDAETDGQPSSDASGDGSDEDGVGWPSMPLAGAYNTVKINASTAGVLNAWLDFDGNEEWNVWEEHVFVNTPLSAGDNYVKFLAPSNASTGPIAARFRFSTEPDLTPLGLAIDGEVEDYVVQLETTAVDEKSPGVPLRNRLTQNYPNPFNPSTKIDFELAKTGVVKLAVYDLTGRRVVLLADGRREAGRYTVAWDGRDSSGRTMPSGLYLVRIEAGDFKQTKKLLLVK